MGSEKWREVMTSVPSLRSPQTGVYTGHSQISNQGGDMAQVLPADPALSFLSYEYLHYAAKQAGATHVLFLSQHFVYELLPGSPELPEQAGPIWLLSLSLTPHVHSVAPHYMLPLCTSR